MDFVKSLKTMNNNLLYLIQGKDKSGREAFYYLLVDKIKKDIFLKDIMKNDADLRKFGKILISGFGKTPSEYAKLYIKNEFGLDTN